MGNQPQPQPPPVQDTLRKVDQAMARLQEIQCTIAGGSKLCGGIALSPRSTRGYLRTSLRCKEESLRMKELAMIVDEETNPDKGQQIVRSSSLRRSSSNGEWRRWSTPAFLIQQAVGEIMEASNLTKEVAHLVSNSIEDKPTESPKSAQNSLNEKPMVDEQNESSCHSDVKHFIIETESQHTDFGEKAGLQTFGSKLPENPVHSFKVIYKDTSSLKHHRKIEKEEYAARVRPESPNPNTRFQRQMSFRGSDQVKKQGGAKILPSSLPVSHCSSPVRLIKEKTTPAKPLLKVEQIKPVRNSWISRSSSTKAIMFPNPTFVPSPLKNNPEVKSTNASMKRKSLPSVKDLKSLRITDYPCNKEEHSGVCMVADSPTVRKSSSFTWMSRSSSTKAIMFPNPAFVSTPLKNNREVKSTNASMKRNSLPSGKDLKSLRITDYPCNKEKHSGVCMVADSPTVRKSSSFSWMSRSSSTKAIMHNPEVKNTNAFMKRNSLPSVKELRSLRISDYPSNTEEHSEFCTVVDSPAVRKSSFFSAAYQPSSSKSIKQSPMSSLLNRTLKKFHVTKISTPSSPQSPSKLDAKTKLEAIPGLQKSESLRFGSSSKMQDFLVRRHSMSSCDPPAESKVSRLSKQHIKALVQLPKKISSVILHPQSVPRVGDVARENGVTTEAEEGPRMRKIDSILSERRKSEILASSAEDVRKQGVNRMEDHYMQSSVPIMENISVNEKQRGRHVQKCNNPLNSTKERHLRPISINSARNSFSRHENNTGSLKEKLYTTESKDKLQTQKIKLQRKENRDNVKDGEEKDKAMKKSTGFLRNSWSFTPDNTRSSHKEKLHTVTGGLPFLKNVK
ncbi:hypothetical protein SUGI_0232050 [Cryptomeria japonica]|uniref:uncharacterized protein LOC131045087 isoform X2 n=1 Tax=Cryptomeria japonica TaxID=3369 RepID=UPI002408E5C8|nr:uncharacterized protein LOC131045087 isoform X2 [Cryptomeria japonica]GLJ14361.1 hypothetical protein SUGI_0232050 [Cryptomeria japonica]